MYVEVVYVLGKVASPPVSLSWQHQACAAVHQGMAVQYCCQAVPCSCIFVRSSRNSDLMHGSSKLFITGAGLLCVKLPHQHPTADAASSITAYTNNIVHGEAGDTRHLAQSPCSMGSSKEQSKHETHQQMY